MPPGPMATSFAAIAQAHATLALVEQQRIANLIAFQERAYLQARVAGGGSESILVDAFGERMSPEQFNAVQSEVREGLGL